MATPVEVPKLGNTVEECVVARWIKRRGEIVEAGDVVAEIETDKATFEVAAPLGGTLLETFFEEGALVPVFTNLFVIGAPGEGTAAFRPQSNNLPTQERVPAGNRPAGEVELAASVPRFTVDSQPAGRALSPRARRFAEEHGFDPGAGAGSGPGGRVLEEDVRRQYHSAPNVPPAPRTIPGTAVASGRVAGIREKIARRMRESLATTAQYTLNASADAGGLLKLRARAKASTGGPNVNINDLVTFCAIRALLRMPGLNAEFIDGKLHPHSRVNLGFACDTPRGLVVPVIENAQTLTIGELASKMKELTAQAIRGTISPDDLSGATFTVSNLGALGIESFTPLLNPPQVAILGVGAIGLKPVRKDGNVEFVDSIGLSLTCDHQVIDGAPGARFLQVIKDQIENVESLCTI